ncbi:MAG: aminotransferase class V-fold PLP-dependent enzyme, partial [Planctomycetota bacterium]
MRASAEDIYLDHHATTPVEPEVVEAMLPYFSEQFANPGSITHRLGRAAASAVQRAVATIAAGLGAAEDEIILTSGATESNNLALLGYCLHPRQERRRIVSVATEHPSVLDPLRRLEKMGFEVVMAPVHGRESSAAGRIRLEETLPLINDETALVSVMLANNEIGTIQP